jgi:hypothetical protein
MIEQFPADFETCDHFTAVHEGGWSDSPHDKGGLTAFGISSVYWPRDRYAWFWIEGGGPTPAKAKLFRYRYFWREHSVGRLPLHYQVCLYDMLINHSSSAAKKILQRGLGGGLKIDGRIGPRTLVRASMDPWRVPRITAKRGKYFAELLVADPANNIHNIDGWLWRATCMGLYAIGILTNTPTDPYGKKPGDPR